MLKHNQDYIKREYLFQKQLQHTQKVDKIETKLCIQVSDITEEYLDQRENTSQLNSTSRSPNQLEQITISEISINWQNIFTTTAQNIAQYLLTKQQSQFNLNLIVQGSQLFNEDQCLKNCKQINKYVYFNCLSLIQNKESIEIEQLDLHLDFNIIYSEAATVIKNMLHKFKSNIKLKHNFNSCNIFDFETVMSSIDKPVNMFKIDICQISNGYIYKEGAQEIANTLAKCQNASYLSLLLDCNNTTHQITKIIANSLEKLEEITQLSLKIFSNKIRIQGAKYILNTIKHFRKVTQLDIDLSNNYITEEVVQCFADSILNCQNITTFNLSLSNSSIDAAAIKHIANSLQKLINLSQLHLNLYQNQIGIDGTRYITGVLNYCNNLNQLSIDLGENDIKDEGASIIAWGLEKCENMTYLKLDLAKNDISSEGAKNISNALKRCNKITSLNIDFKNNQIDGKGLNSVINIIFKCQKITLACLNFNHNKINENLSLNIENNDEKSHNITQFSLDLSGNTISLEQAQNITHCLKRCKNLQNLNLSLLDSNLENELFLIIFLQNCQSLTKQIDLRKSRISAKEAKSIALLNHQILDYQIVSEGIIGITNAQEKCQRIRKLNLNFCKLEQESDISKIFSGYLWNSENISELRIQFDGYTHFNILAKNICNVLKQCQNLTQLSLKFLVWNKEQDIIHFHQNFQNLSGQIEILQNLSRLKLSFKGHQIDEEGAYYISRAFVKCQKITQLKLNFCDNSIKDKGAQKIASAIEKCQNITNLNLNLGRNQIQDEGAQSISNTLEKCQNITKLSLNLSEKKISKEGRKEQSKNRFRKKSTHYKIKI
ncbi:kinase domain protein, putative (macronuclear) [Tetrahymena thermophila SB210]|uniref:Kinase domain protein, putative n=1 Tax=Tetrahymena thermophila (strain SB210) TaxID=312017 RepID=W7X5U0_TETTS|nr:kinase domain protein, putative [Tetrahymena thermophila SB210]EWS71723.1 kinase domain protein, putative [Tetrahymena thermophila SB210]|eukprot:XP_012655744.1 kinase domain protein, putative [Tetrahymena thermophila SB210]